MLQSKMIIYADFPEWDSYSDPVKSLINFFMKESSCFFKGSYSGNVLQSMSGNVRFNLHPIMQIDDDPSEFSLKESVELDIAYTNQNIPSTASDFLPDCNTTLEVKNTFLKVCKIDTENVETYTGGIAPLDSIPVILTPKVDDVVHTNPTARPKNLNTNPDNIVEVPIYTENVDFNATYQLRSSSFYIKDASTGLGADVYYKIGICPLDKKYPYKNFSDTPVTPGVSLADIKSLIQNDELYLNIDDTYIEGLFYKLLQCTLATEKDSFNSGKYGFVSSIIVPIVNDSNQIIGVGYIKLFNQDGTEYNTDIKDKTIKIYCRPDEEEDPEFVKMGDQYGLHLTITDQMLDGGYIQTQYTPGITDEFVEPLMILAIQDNTVVTLGSTQRTYQKSLDNVTWEDFTASITLNNTDKIYIRAKENQNLPPVKIGISGKAELYNNINSLLSPDFTNIFDLTPYGSSCFSQHFFNNSSITKAPLLPATTLTNRCYYRMFYGCTSLIESPELPSETLVDSCYYEMFRGCISLIKVPKKLTCVTASTSSCGYMFYGCTSLVDAPKLDFGSLYDSCCVSMFQNCALLKNIPDIDFSEVVPLSDLTASSGPFVNMFRGCTSLVNAPRLSPVDLLNNACENMYYGCVSLKNIPSLKSKRIGYHTYASMFEGCTSLENAPSIEAEEFLDSVSYSYEPCFKMFKGCTALVNAPELPSVSISRDCYAYMFAECVSLVNAPELPATNLKSACYTNMFDGCTSLVNGPSILPATTLADNCYYYMFNGCTALENAPELPATTLAYQCYYNMFGSCSSLIKAPDLPATTLENSCYVYMFAGCSSLNYLKVFAVTIPSSSTTSMLNVVSSSGDIYCTESWNLIPSGWVRHTITP